MKNDYRNSEGYADPTAGRALENVAREERKINRKPRKHRGRRRRNSYGNQEK